MGRSGLFLWTLARRQQCLSGGLEHHALGKPVEARLSQPSGGFKQRACLSAVRLLGNCGVQSGENGQAPSEHVG